MNRPTWALVIGILGIVFGSFGILGAGYEMAMPKILQFQKKMIDEIQQSSDRKQGQTTPQNNPDEMLKTMQAMWNLPDWFQTWSIFSGIAKMLISAFYIFASILLLQTKPSGIRFFYWAAGSSIFLNIAKAVITLLASIIMGISMLFGVFFSVIIDIVLIVVVATGNKEAFYQTPPPLKA